MAFNDRINESIRGRNLGFEYVSSARHGSTQGGRMLTGPDAYRGHVSTAESTATPLRAFGVSYLIDSSAGSSQVWKLDPPIPGVVKTIIFGSSGNTQYLSLNPLSSVASVVTVITATQGTTKSVIASSAQPQALRLVGVTTAVWAAGSISSGVLSFTTTT